MSVVSIEIDYNDAFTTVFWNQKVRCRVVLHDGMVLVQGNMECFRALVQQLVYFASFDYRAPGHVHLDNSFGICHEGPELSVEVIPGAKVEWDIEMPVFVNLDVPEERCALYEGWNKMAQVLVKASYDSVYILGNRDGFLFLATALMFLLKHSHMEDALLCNEVLLPGWHGNAIRFALWLE